ncbi:hypothetical protein WJX72_011654 [[Myrmecia] bisecta]
MKQVLPRTPDTLLQTWQQSLSGLESIGSVTGWEYKPNQQSEAELMDKVTGDLLTVLTGKKRVLSALVGMDDRVPEILQRPEMHQDKRMKILGLTGMGGIGKTTLATALYNRLLPGIASSCCFPADVRSCAAEAGGLQKMQQYLLQQLCGWMDAPLPRDVEEGKSLLQQRVGGAKVLLVLDDVAAGSRALEALLVTNTLAAGSCILITSREREQLQAAGCELIVDVGLLKDEQARQLFCLHAFPDGPVPEGLAGLAEKVVTACAGLPLTLKVLGRYLQRKPNNIWLEALRSLTRAKDLPDSDEKVFRRLRISYDGLDWEEQQMFLDVACLLLGRSAAAAKSVWAG